MNVKTLVGLRHSGLRQHLQQANHLGALGNAAASQLTDHERVGQHRGPIEQRDQAGVAAPKVVNPNRGVDEDQDPRCGRRRGAALRAG